MPLVLFFQLFQNIYIKYRIQRFNIIALDPDNKFVKATIRIRNVFMENVHRVCSTILRRLRAGKKKRQTHPSNIVAEESRTFCVSSLVKKKGANSRHVFAAESLRMS